MRERHKATAVGERCVCVGESIRVSVLGLCRVEVGVFD